MKNLTFKADVWRRSFLLMSSLLVLGGCRFTEGDTKVQYMPDMADSPTVKAQENFIDPPEHSVPVNGVLYPASLAEAEKELKNPYPPSEQIIAEGKLQYETYCAVCHGASGNGENSLGPKFIKVTDISAASYKEKNDAFFFYIITFGGANMPPYGDKTSAQERWKIVHFLRTLQN